MPVLRPVAEPARLIAPVTPSDSSEMPKALQVNAATLHIKTRQVGGARIAVDIAAKDHVISSPIRAVNAPAPGAEKPVSCPLP